jgi:hypothetical protein
MVAGLGQMTGETVGEKLEDQYQALREKCIESFGLEFCTSVLPGRLYNAMGQRQFSLPWWAWMLLGLLVGRVLRV